MRKTLRITVDGRSHDVVVEDVDEAASPAITPPALTPAKPVSPPPPVAPVAAPTAAGPGAIVAPLGGMVVSIDVGIGQEVAAGDKVATIEAMKMQTEVRSKVAGKVISVTAKANEPVDTGQTLLTVG
jgi:biotin carboxyl carrier protein